MKTKKAILDLSAYPTEESVTALSKRLIEVADALLNELSGYSVSSRHVARLALGIEAGEQGQAADVYFQERSPFLDMVEMILDRGAKANFWVKACGGLNPSYVVPQDTVTTDDGNPRLVN
jgi:hypothetical protein